MLYKLYEKTIKLIKNNKIELILITLLLILYFVKLPYVVLAPGGTIDTFKRVEVDNATKSEGSLNMAYVSMYDGSISNVLLSYIMPNWDLAKEDEVALDNESMKNALKRDKYYLEESLDAATLVAYNAANKSVNIVKKCNVIVYISGESKTNLELYDIILSVNGTTIDTLADYKKIISNSKVGDKINYIVLRKDKQVDAYSKVIDIDGPNTGLMFITDYKLNTIPDVDFKLKNSESGPSGGLILALTIYDQLVDKDITKGLNVVGTGTINEKGEVGEIGGVKYKVMSAYKNNADIFLVPKGNYKEAEKVVKTNNYDLKLVSISTFEEALKALS